MEPSVQTLQRTPLYETHCALGARMMPFGGFEMPVQYSGILDEHRAVREAAGLFDVSHMGEVLVQGTGALPFVQHLVTNDAAALTDGRAMYTVMCNPNGGTVDDLLVYRMGEASYLLVINASNIEKDVAHLRAVHAGGDFDCTVEDVSETMGLLALQGPKAFDIVAEVTDLPVADVGYYHFMRPEPGAFLGCDKVILSHTGYTGERGLEIYCEAGQTEHVWNALLKAGEKHGLLPAGLGARDTLRLEAGYCLYGHELTEKTTPLEAGLGWVTKLGKEHFVGRGSLAAQKERGVPRRLVGFVVDERGIPRQGYPITDLDGKPVGAVTSGSQSPLLGQGIGLGYVPNDDTFTTPGAAVGIAVRGRILPATVTKPPFHKS